MFLNGYWSVRKQRIFYTSDVRVHDLFVNFQLHQSIVLIFNSIESEFPSEFPESLRWALELRGTQSENGWLPYKLDNE